MQKSTLTWQETKNGITIDCSLDFAIHPADSDTILLTIPGVDGSLDGYDNKYVRMANKAQVESGVTVVRIENPFITSFHWESNPRRILEYIRSNTATITRSQNQPRIKVVAHSAGASVIAKIAHEYDTITDLLLVNPAEALDADAIRVGLEKTQANVTVMFGSNDPSVRFAEGLKRDGHRVVILDGVDHHFSGDALDDFIDLPVEYLL